MAFPGVFNITTQEVGTLKHTWNNKALVDTVSYVRNSTFFPGIPLFPIATVNWYQAWNPSDEGPSVSRLEMEFRGAYIDRMLQR